MNNPVRRYIGTYTIGDDTNLEGWTPERLKFHLVAPLGEIGIRVRYTPNQDGTGLELYDVDTAREDRIRDDVKHIVDRVIEEGPE